MIRTATLLLVAAASVSGGCAALTNPVADGIPVRRLPAEVLGRPKEEMRPIPLTLLRQKEQKEYRLAPGDVLAVVAENVISPPETQLPVKLPDQGSDTAAVGFPVPVNDDGTIVIPGLKAIEVTGKTPREVEELIRDAATGQFGNRQYIPPANRDTFRASVQILRKREYTIRVQREDVAGAPSAPVYAGFVGPQPVVGSTKRVAGFLVKLKEGENDLLTALNSTGGLPGVDAKNFIIIERGRYDPDKPGANMLKIPMRLYPEEPLFLREEDIILKDGDIVRIESRDSEVFHTAGLTGGGEFPLPQNRDLRVLEAIAMVRGPLLNGGFSQNLFIGNAVNSGVGNPSPSLCVILRRLPDGQQIPIRVDLNRAFRDPRENILIQPGDFLTLQETSGEAITRYFTQSFRLITIFDVIRSPSVNGTLTGTNP